jgi:AraC-like DNA-binding protein
VPPKLSAVSPEPSFVSSQVTEARRYYLNLNPPEKTPFCVVCGGVERMRPEYVVSRRDFPYLAVEMVVEGEGTLRLGGRRFRLAPGILFAYGPGVPHTIRSHPQRCMRKYYLDFAGTAARKLLQATGLADWKVLRVAAVHELVDIFEAIGREARDDSAIANNLCETLARLLLLKIEQRAISGGQHMPRSFATYERVRRHVERHFTRLHTVEDISRQCHVAPAYISRLFRRFNGTGAYHFLLRLKMNRAAELLLEDRLLVKQVAARLGFADAFQFSRAFKRVYGVSPTRLLESIR